MAAQGWVLARGRQGQDSETLVFVCSTLAMAREQYLRCKRNPRLYYVRLMEKAPKYDRDTHYVIWEM